MKYKKEERLDIGRQIYNGEISRYEAAEQYGIGEQTARNYMRLYRDINQLPPKHEKSNRRTVVSVSSSRNGRLAIHDERAAHTGTCQSEDYRSQAKKRIRGEGGWYGNSVRQQEYQVIMELSGEFPVKLLCETTGILRSSFYSWKKQLSNPSDRAKNFVSNILLFQEYHLKYPSHGYRWLNAKIRMDTGLVLSDPYAHKCCSAL